MRTDAPVTPSGRSSYWLAKSARVAWETIRIGALGAVQPAAEVRLDIEVFKYETAAILPLAVHGDSCGRYR